MSIFKKVLKVLGIILGIIVLAAAGFFIWLTVNEYRPDDIEKVDIDTSETSGKELKQGEEIKLMTWNLGFGALGDNADFFMDGGTMVMPATRERMDVNLAGIRGHILAENPDILMLQEIDRNSKRSYHVDQIAEIKGNLTALGLDPYVSTFAHNFKVKYVPYPVNNPIGDVESGINTLSRYTVDDAERISLPCPFKWPVKTANLKRCLLVNRIAVKDKDGKDTGKELVIVNLHLEAYDDGEGKKEQTKVLNEYIEGEYKKGNYVIAGGDFNQTFSNVDKSMYPPKEGLWQCGELDVSEFSDKWQFVMDNSTPTCRSLDQPYQGSDKENFLLHIMIPVEKI